MNYCEAGDHEAGDLEECNECGVRFCKKHGNLNERLCNECKKLHDYGKEKTEEEIY